MDFDVNVRERILRPVKMSNYFISGASGPLKAGTAVAWEFADSPWGRMPGGPTPCGA
ncbi:MAG: hypothetical protein ACRD8O_22270 [Bryobacteraceae bacterium]